MPDEGLLHRLPEQVKAYGEADRFARKRKEKRTKKVKKKSVCPSVPLYTMYISPHRDGRPDGRTKRENYGSIRIVLGTVPLRTRVRQ